MGVDELEQLELQVDTSVRQIRSTTVSKMHTICQLPQIVDFLGTGEVVRIETTNGWCLPVHSLPSHVHCAITPAQLGLSVYQTLGSTLTTTKQYQRFYAEDVCTVKKPHNDLQEQIPGAHYKSTSTAQHTTIYYFQLPSITDHQAEDNNITDDLEVTLTITDYNQNEIARLDVDLIITDLE
ncbi:hypothetical protein YC2023_017191 [Brassica napus]